MRRRRIRDNSPPAPPPAGRPTHHVPAHAVDGAAEIDVHKRQRRGAAVAVPAAAQLLDQLGAACHGVSIAAAQLQQRRW